ncbi:hypothetical protein HELRODRAFT_177416 [Helobdella robusta]|uniref:Calponin-homology (CH) domain-containing protein n=1 Tax=Helobdella robusta TaxID=6412 RepID=T1FBN3_HELRO|nr:hypothetical protein HELRODRAFT_177416 [Helobdella robusta]ESN98171.1 hypothetical protein HELRODRAFT_177416 [Helobdella robusta]
MGSMNSEDENWYACSDWLERCAMITVEQNKSISSIEHLATILKDGVLLCNLCNKIKPGSIDIKQTSQKPQYSQFLWQRNVHTFLMACQNAFGLDKKKHLFEVPDLVELQNFGKVIFTLSKLSQTKEARAKNIKKDMLVEDDDSFSLYGTSLDDLGNSDVCEEIYDTLVYGSMQKPAAKASTPRTKKDSCLDELVATEKNFIDVLAMINNIFARNLKSHLSASESNEVFFKIEDLHKVHQDFYRKILAARNSGSPAQEVSKSFIEFKLPFTIYGDYVAHINRSTAALDAICTTNSPARKLIEDGAIVAKVKLRDLLTVPVQRILKYHIIIKDLNVYINEVKRDSENLDTTREVQSR